METNFEGVIEREELIKAYYNKDRAKFDELVNKHEEFIHIELFIRLAEMAYEHFVKSKYCTFMLNPDTEFFSLVDCTFRGYSFMLYIDSEDENINDYPILNYDRSCMLYIEIPEDFDDDPTKYKNEFINDAILAIAENYKTVSEEDAQGLSGKQLPNPNYVKK